MQTMQTRLRGQEELNQSFKEWIQDFLRELPPEERLRGLGPEDLRRLPAAERQRLRELLDLAEPTSR
jgi:hypothetical protein